MDLPPIDHPIWNDLVTGKIKFEFDFLALKLLLVRISIDIQSEASPSRIQACSKELHNLFAKNLRNPRVQHDLKRALKGAFL